MTAPSANRRRPLAEKLQQVPHKRLGAQGRDVGVVQARDDLGSGNGAIARTARGLHRLGGSRSRCGGIDANPEQERLLSISPIVQTRRG